MDASISAEAALRTLAASPQAEVDAAPHAQPDLGDRVRAALPAAPRSNTNNAPPMARLMVARPPSPFMPMFGGPQFGAYRAPIAQPIVVPMGAVPAPPPTAAPQPARHNQEAASSASASASIAQHDADFTVPVRGRDISCTIATAAYGTRIAQDMSGPIMQISRTAASAMHGTATGGVNGTGETTPGAPHGMEMFGEEMIATLHSTMTNRRATCTATSGRGLGAQPCHR